MAIDKKYQKLITEALAPHGHVQASGIKEQSETVDTISVITKDTLHEEDLERIFRMICRVPHKLSIVPKLRGSLSITVT